jgi:three-Cys-motif partner protein
MCADLSNGSSSDEGSPRLPTEWPELVTPEPKVPMIKYPIWTENKAKLIERYLLYFVYITKHGTYIDGFAGPQEPDKPEMWAAKLVLDNEPKWLKHFYLFEQNKKSVEQLRDLKAAQPVVDSRGKSFTREIEIFEGDFNQSIQQLLSSGCISQREATFCLLDQRTFECQWSSVESLARYKTEGHHKIELFYFLAIGWLDRALSALQDRSKLERWWGRNDYEDFCGMDSNQRREAFVSRFKKELGYKSVKPWPIYENQSSKKVMYYMIHATDHPKAPEQMSRAYRHAVDPKEPHVQLAMEFGVNPDDPGEAN